MQASPTLQMLSRAQDLIAKGVDVIDFAPGEPDFETPTFVREAGKRAIDEGHTKYTAASARSSSAERSPLFTIADIPSN